MVKLLLFKRCENFKFQNKQTLSNVEIDNKSSYPNIHSRKQCEMTYVIINQVIISIPHNTTIFTEMIKHNYDVINLAEAV